MYLEQTGQFRTDSMFSERIAKRHKDVGTKPVYCLAERQENKGLPRLYEVFINSADEYDFAIKAFGSKAHLDKLKNIKWFTEGFRTCSTFRGYNAWLDDMQERDQSMAKKVIMEKAMEGDVNAAKKLSDMSKADSGSKRGRPKKEDIARAARDKADETSGIEEDLRRLNVVKIR